MTTMVAAIARPINTRLRSVKPHRPIVITPAPEIDLRSVLREAGAPAPDFAAALAQVPVETRVDYWLSRIVLHAGAVPLPISLRAIQRVNRAIYDQAEPNSVHQGRHFIAVMRDLKRATGTKQASAALARDSKRRLLQHIRDGGPLTDTQRRMITRLRKEGLLFS